MAVYTEPEHRSPARYTLAVPPYKKKTSRTLAPDPAEVVPPTNETTISALRPVGTDGASVSIIVERKKVAKVDTTWAMDEGLHSEMPWTHELAARVHAAAKRHAAFAHAVRLTGVRQRSAYDLTRKLKLAGHDEPDARASVEKLQDLGIINDDTLAARLAEELARSGKHGARGIELKLRTRGIGSDLARSASREAIEESGDPDAVLTLARKRAAQLARFEPDVARRRLYSFLLRRGFEHDQVRRAVDTALNEPEPSDLH